MNKYFKRKEHRAVVVGVGARNGDKGETPDSMTDDSGSTKE